MSNTFAMMLVVIGLSLFGKSELAADFGIVHGATVALFYSFSGNARSLILSGNQLVGIEYILRLRCFLLVPLCAIAFTLSIGLVESGWLLVTLLVARRACEWLAEVFLCDQEHNHRPVQALRFFITQGAFSVLVLAALSSNHVVGYWVLAAWAISPLCWSIRLSMFTAAFKRNGHRGNGLQLLLPHFGSTAVIGVSVYVFRLFIILLAGRQVAGDLFSAFAVGGILGTVFTQALGPTLIRHEEGPSHSTPMVRLVNLFVVGSFGMGLLMVGAAWFLPESLLWTGKASLFWLAVGCSLIGGAIMVRAQRVRLRLLQNNQGQDAFGSDMLANILLVGSIPLLYYGLGVTYLAALYLISSLLALVFYTSERDGILGVGRFVVAERKLLLGVAFALFFPLFFQLANGIYQGRLSDFANLGQLEFVPIPISVLACYIGIVIFGQYSKIRVSLMVLFLLFMAMLLTTLVSATDYGVQEQAKLILLVQYMLPMFALVLGQQYGMKVDAIFEMAKSLTFMLLVIVPLQLFVTIFQGFDQLSPVLYLFGIYQHFQYVPVMFVGGFLIALFALWHLPAYRLRLLLLSALMGCYVSFSASLSTFLLIALGGIGFFVREVLKPSVAPRELSAALMVCVCVALGLAFRGWDELIEGVLGVGHSNVSLSNYDASLELHSVSFDERVAYWKFYLSGIAQDVSSFVLGHVKVLDRNQFPSAHNYYLDFIYHFGFFAILPLLGLILFTVYSVVGQASRIWRNPGLLGVSGVLLFLLFVDNMLKVGMRQPYSGIITFFLWGVVISACIKLKRERKGGGEIDS